MINKLLLFASFFVFIACTTSKILITGNSYPPYEGKVKIYQSPPEDIEYEEIGFVSASEDLFSSGQWVDVVINMQKKAAEHGANAIILIQEENEQYGIISGSGSGLVGGSGSLKKMVAIAIRVKE